jgi:hypothetical protein
VTASQVRQLGRAQELPLAASLPEVDVQTTLRVPIELDSCGVHPDNPDAEIEIPHGRWRISHRFSEGASLRVVDVCGSECAQWELMDLLSWGVYELNLLLPSDWAETPLGAGEDPAFADIERCVEHLRSMRNTCRTGEGWDGFEECRKAAIAAVSQIGVKRVGDLERSAA